MPDTLAKSFVHLEVVTARTHGWDELKNGFLLRAADEVGYVALITIDRGFEYQQNLTGSGIGVVLLKCHPATSERLSLLVPQAEQRILEGVTGQVVVLTIDRDA